MVTGAALLLALGCSDSSETPSNNPTPTDGDAAVSALYALCGFTIDADANQIGVMFLSDTIGSDAELKLEDGFELRGSCVARGEDLFVAGRDSPVLTRFAISDSGVPEETGRLSFAPTGLSTISTRSSRFQFFSDTKAYLLDPTNREVIIWNPRDLELVGSFPIPGLDPPPGFVSAGIGGIARVDNRIIVPFWQGTADGVTAPRTAFAFIDGDTDSATVDVITNCGGINWSKVTSSGDIYFSTGGATVAAGIAGVPGTSPPCMVRVGAGESQVDDSFFFSPNDYTGAPTAALLPAPGDRSYVIAYDEALGPAPGGLSPIEVIFAPAWGLHSVAEVGVSTTATRVQDVEPAAGRPTAFLVDDRAYISLGAADFSSSTLVDVTNPESVTTAATAPMVIAEIFRLR